jgi:hypothetical protein
MSPRLQGEDNYAQLCRVVACSELTKGARPGGVSQLSPASTSKPCSIVRLDHTVVVALKLSPEALSESLTLIARRLEEEGQSTRTVYGTCMGRLASVVVLLLPPCQTSAVWKLAGRAAVMRVRPLRSRRRAPPAQNPLIHSCPMWLTSSPLLVLHSLKAGVDDRSTACLRALRREHSQNNRVTVVAWPCDTHKDGVARLTQNQPQDCTQRPITSTRTKH